MVSFLQRLSMPFLIGEAHIDATVQIRPLTDGPASVRLHRWGGRPGKSKTTVAQDRRRAAKARAVKRAKRHGQA